MCDITTRAVGLFAVLVEVIDKKDTTLVLSTLILLIIIVIAMLGLMLLATISVPSTAILGLTSAPRLSKAKLGLVVATISASS